MRVGVRFRDRVRDRVGVRLGARVRVRVRVRVGVGCTCGREAVGPCQAAFGRRSVC